MQKGPVKESGQKGTTHSGSALGHLFLAFHPARIQMFLLEEYFIYIYILYIYFIHFIVDFKTKKCYPWKKEKDNI